MEVGPRGVSVCSLGGNRAGEIRLTRLLRNRKVSVEKMVECAYAGTCKRVAGLHVLAIQDTTSLRDDGGRHSIAAHPTIAVDAEAGTLLGLVHAQVLKRKGGLKASRAARAIEDKESWRWLEAAEVAAGLPRGGGGAGDGGGRPGRRHL